MKMLMLTLFSTVMYGLAFNASASEKADPVLIFDNFLSRYVTADGLVDYKGLKKEKEFKKYIEYLSQTNPDDLPSGKHRMAFWINAYNAFVIKGVLDEYPIKSVLKVGWIPHSFFKRKIFQIYDGDITLQALEDEKLREAFREPRIHFAINCASISCPKLLTETYKAEKLEGQLEAQAVSFINDRSRNYLDKENGVLYLSRIFKWYRGDFLKSVETIEEYVAGYLNQEDAEFIRNNEVAIKYLDYDWGLNGQK